MISSSAAEAYDGLERASPPRGSPRAIRPSASRRRTKPFARRRGPATPWEALRGVLAAEFDDGQERQRVVERHEAPLGVGDVERPDRACAATRRNRRRRGP